MRLQFKYSQEVQEIVLHFIYVAQVCIFSLNTAKKCKKLCFNSFILVWKIVLQFIYFSPEKDIMCDILTPGLLSLKSTAHCSALDAHPDITTIVDWP